MKATLEFKLPEDQYDLNCALKATRMQTAVRDFAEESLRRRRKYDEAMTEDQGKLIADLEKEFWELFSELLED